MKICSACEFGFVISARLSRNGTGYLKKNALSFNRAAANGLPTILLTDLDAVECPSTLRSQWLREELHENFLFRVACREVEAWLLADRIAFSLFLGISKDKLKSPPDEIADPKAYIINLARKSKNPGIRSDIPPLHHANASIGPGYNSRLVRFIVDIWNPLEASHRSPSLLRAIKAMSALHTRLLKVTDHHAK